MAWRHLRTLLAWVLVALALGAHAQTAELKRATLRVNGAAQEQGVTLPYHLDRAQGTHPAMAVFEVPFSLTMVEQEPYAVYFPRIGNAAEIWLNETLLARLGDISDANGEDFSKGPQYVPIPPRLLQKDNLFRIHLRSDGGRRGGLSAPVIGPADEVRGIYVHAYGWRMVASLTVAIFSVLVGSLALVLWATQFDPGQPRSPRRDTLYLSAAVAELCWALRVGDIAIEHPPLPWPAWGVVVTAAFAGWICCIALFCHHVAGWNRHRSMVWFSTWLWLLFGSAILASALSFSLHQPLYLTVWLGCANVFFVGYAIVYLAGAVRSPTPARLLVAVAGALNVVVGVRDWVAIRISGSYDESTWIRYSSVLFGLALGYIVVMRFRAATGQARDLMETLASRVAQKEAELQATYARVEGLAREQERAGERARILRDMHDGVGSHISAAIRQLESGRASNAEVLSTLRDSLDQLKLSIDAMNLPPGDITALLANLRYRLEPRFAASDIELQWDVDLLEPLNGLDAQAMRQLQFMVFEALSNVLQHANASVLRIEVHGRDEGGARVRIADNGRGFDIAIPPRKGLLSMRERAGAIGARLDIASGPKGTAVNILLG